MQKKKRWTEEEINILKENIDKTETEISKILKNKTPGAVGVKRREILFTPGDSRCSKCNKEYYRTRCYSAMCDSCYEDSLVQRRIKAQIKKAEDRNKDIINKIETAKKRFYKCPACNTIKTGDNFSYGMKTGKRLNICLECDRARALEKKKQRIKEGTDW